MKLYYMPGACSLSPHIVLREVGAEFELKKVDRQKKVDDGADYLAINPKGSVPALEVQPGVVLTEGPAIVQFVGDAHPEAGLTYASGIWRYRVQEWLNFVTSEVHKAFSPLFNGQAPAGVHDYSRSLLQKKLGYLNDTLQRSEYLVKGTFSVADAYLFVVLRWAAPMKVDLAAYPHVNGFLERVGGRPKVKEALAAEGLT